MPNAVVPRPLLRGLVSVLRGNYARHYPCRSLFERAVMSDLPTAPVARSHDFAIRYRAIPALMLREMSTRYGRTPGGYLWAILEPLGMIIILSIVYSYMAGTPPLGTSFLLFKATGFMILQVFTVLGGQVGNALAFSKPLLRYPRVTWGDAILARFVLNSLVLFGVTILILWGIILYDGLSPVLRWGAVIEALVLAALLGLGVASLNCYLFMRFPVWQQLWAIITRPLFLISGVILLYDDMPDEAQNALWYNPLLHLTGLIRVGFYPLYRPDYISLLYVGFCITIPMALGLLLLHRYHRDLLNR
ncbi:ABC transporter permease [Pararhodobacter sp. CCB-MM2]|uniref:ABC transporter permease n=1 Tax=Pararhodobacter sp. CCB-MM2 TaxID=1786003 RepID=UPI001F46F32C|nr:ABC transporter permease [Pararhodobacter sp. CCB-MM2]